MPIKVDSVSRINMRNRSNSIIKRRTVNAGNVVDPHGLEIIKNSKFHPIHALILKLLDGINPILVKYPKIENKVLNICGKLLKNADILNK